MVGRELQTKFRLNRTYKTKCDEGMKRFSASTFRCFNILFFTALFAVLLCATGCGLFHHSNSQPKAAVALSQLRTNVAPEVTLTVLQLQVMRFADGYVAQVAQAADEFTRRVGTPQARVAALRWKLGQGTAMYEDASGQNPVVNALDVLVLTSVSRMVIEDYAAEVYGTNALPVLEVHRQLETNIWTMSSAILKPDQQDELRLLIQEWRAAHPHLRNVGAVRFREFVAAMGKTPTKATPNSVFSLLMLDPFAGLDPTAAAIEETRQLGERAMYYTQRMPQLISWQTELLAYEMAMQPESTQVLSNANQIAASAEMFAKTTQQLPQLIAEQRQAAIQQVLDGLRSQEADVQKTLNSGAEAATAIDGAIKSLDGFVRFVSAPDTNHTATSTNRHPFNVVEYGVAAGQIGNAAHELNTLLTNLNATTPQLAELSKRTREQADEVVIHATKAGILLITFFLLGSILAALLYRGICNKWLNASKKKLDDRP
jgi:hypothetical protein